MGEDNYRMQRIERLLKELRYEVERGMLEREIEEQIGFSFVVPMSKHFKNGVVHCEFRTRPVQHMAYLGGDLQEPKLRVVQGGKP